MTARYQALKTAQGFIVYGPFGAVMRADADKSVTYCNINAGEPPYRALLKALRAA